MKRHVLSKQTGMVHLYPVVSSTPFFFHTTWGLGFPATWHSKTTLPPSTSLWADGFLMKKGEADSPALTSVKTCSFCSTATLKKTNSSTEDQNSPLKIPAGKNISHDSRFLLRDSNFSHQWYFFSAFNLFWHWNGEKVGHNISHLSFTDIYLHFF